jgi:DNA-binding transcriptional MerR regulator
VTVDIRNVQQGEAPYGIDDLARLGGVSRRTVRYYVQEGLLPAPRGVGRGAHYGPEHLERLLRVKALQEQGASLEQVRRSLSGRAQRSAPVESEAPVEREALVRLRLAPGVELTLSGEARVPSPERLAELCAWCRRHCRPADGGAR